MYKRKCMKYELPELKFSFEGLEPNIDSKTVEVHYTKHHQGYLNKTNELLEKYPELMEKSIEELLSDLNSIPEDIRQGLVNVGGGYYNHNIYWETMTGEETEIPSDLVEKINSKWGSVDSFKETFTENAMKLFGSGWVWLVQSDTELEIVSSKNQENPISNGKYPLLGIDLWEHAYYLKYQNRRNEYIDSWFKVIDWNAVEKRIRV